MTWLSNVQNVLLRCRKKTSCKTTKTRNRPVETGGGEAGGTAALPRFLLKFTFYQLTMIVKTKEEPKNINHIKFLENYWNLFSCSCNAIPVMNKTNFDWHCIFCSAFFFYLLLWRVLLGKIIFHKTMPFALVL